MTPTSNPESTQTPNPESTQTQIQTQTRNYYYNIRLKYDRRLQKYGWLDIPDRLFYIRSDAIAYINNLSGGKIYFSKHHTVNVHSNYMYCQISDYIEKILNDILINKILENPNEDQYIITADDVKAYEKEVLEKIKECEDIARKLELKNKTKTEFDSLLRKLKTLLQKLKTDEARIEFIKYYNELIDKMINENDIVKELNNKISEFIQEDNKYIIKKLEEENKRLNERIQELEQHIEKLIEEKEEEDEEEEDE